MYKRQVLRDVDLTIREGEMVTIIGASGAGKSTFLHCLGTLDLPTRGAIRFGGMDVTSLSPVELAAFRNRTIGFVFQFHHLLPDFSALENVMMPALIARTSRREAAARATGTVRRASRDAAPRARRDMRPIKLEWQGEGDAERHGGVVEKEREAGG